jgi:signal transduction histidine kinase/ligand-binding sensor domain-containing protein
VVQTGRWSKSLIFKMPGSTRLNGRCPRLGKVRATLLLFSCLGLLARTARGLDPNVHISQYAHMAWRVQDGFFSGAPTTIAQTKDGYLWIGTPNGLFQFDGVHFSRWNPSQKDLQYASVYSLLGTDDGSLWIGTGTGLSRWDGRILTHYTGSLARVNDIIEDHDGSIWITRSRIPGWSGPLCQVDHDRLRCYGTSDGIPIPYATSLTEDLSGALWLGGSTALVRWRPGLLQTFPLKSLSKTEGLGGVSDVAIQSPDSFWVGIDRSGKGLGLEQLVRGQWRPFSTVKFDDTQIAVSTLFTDRQGALWIGTDQGVFRIYKGIVDRFDRTDGLSSDMVSRFFEDHEGNIWVATSKGIDAFRPLAVRTYSRREGFSSDDVDSVVAARDGTVWVGTEGALHGIRNGGIFSILSHHGLPGDRVTSLFEDRTGVLWVGVDNGLFMYRNGRFTPILDAEGKTLGIVSRLSEDIAGDMWLKAYHPPHQQLFRIRGRHVVEIRAPEVANSFDIAADPSGGIWASSLTGDLAHYSKGHVETFPIERATHAAGLYILLAAPDGFLWGAGPKGLVGFRNGKAQSLTERNGLPCNGIYTIVLDNHQSLWLYAQCGLIKITGEELNRWWKHPDRTVDFRRFDEFDGVQPGAASFRPSAACSPDGRLWFANDGKLQTIDPLHLLKNMVPPPVRTESIIADTKIYPSTGTVRLPSPTRDIEIRYTAFSYVVPERVRFRYKLNGYDTDWQEAGTRRSAFYMNLSPGQYQFHVIACNNDGVWNQIGASVNLLIPPAWYQTFWFRALSALVGIALGVLFYRYKLAQAAALLRTRFDERFEERTRLARDLHDTLIQTIQGSKLVADNAKEAPADLERMRDAISLLSTWLGRAIMEGRAALSSLRISNADQNDLAEALRRAGEECQNDSSTHIVVTVRGSGKEMQPLVRDEIYRIGYEAISNACSHSGGTQVSVDLEYGRDFKLSIRDNGRGMDANTLAFGKPEHYGLQGMRERARQIGAKLAISSSPEGTRIKLLVPGKVIFKPL